MNIIHSCFFVRYLEQQYLMCSISHLVFISNKKRTSPISTNKT